MRVNHQQQTKKYRLAPPGLACSWITAGVAGAKPVLTTTPQAAPLRCRRSYSPGSPLSAYFSFRALSGNNRHTPSSACPRIIKKTRLQSKMKKSKGSHYVFCDLAAYPAATCHGFDHVL
jgi:hypothetical protein